MTIFTRLSKVGERSALFFDRNLLDQLGINAESQVKITVVGDGKTLQVEIATDEELAAEGKRRFETGKKEDLDSHDDVYRKLADR